MKVKRIVQKTTHHPSPGEQEVVLEFIPENTTDQKNLQNLEKAIDHIPDLLGHNVNTVTHKIERKDILKFEIFIQV